MRKALATTALIGAVASIPASKFKGITEAPLQRAAEALWPATEQQKQLVGTDPTGHLENMPPAVLADRVARCLGRGPLDTPTKLRVQSIVHYTFGATFGGMYGALAEAFPAATTAAGTAAVRACMRQPTGRRCRCCGSRSLRGACRVPRSRGSSPVTCCSAWLWNSAVGALPAFPPCGPELRVRRTPGARVVSSRDPLDTARGAAIFVLPGHEMEQPERISE